MLRVLAKAVNQIAPAGLGAGGCDNGFDTPAAQQGNGETADAARAAIRRDIEDGYEMMTRFLNSMQSDAESRRRNTRR